MHVNGKLQGQDQLHVNSSSFVLLSLKLIFFSSFKRHFFSSKLTCLTATTRSVGKCPLVPENYIQCDGRVVGKQRYTIANEIALK
jgi:hypothetical protein